MYYAFKFNFIKNVLKILELYSNENRDERNFIVL